nr:putative NRPS/PKS hybrid synthase module E2B [uncultured bacterium]
MDNSNQIETGLKDFIKQAINIEGLSEHQNLFETGIVNSLFAVQLMTFVERTYGIEIGADDLDIENFKSVRATADFVRRKSAASVL